MTGAPITAAHEAASAGPDRSPARLGLGRIAFVAFALMMSMHAFYALFQGPPPEVSSQQAVVPTKGDNILYVGLWLALYGCSAWVMLKGILLKGLEYRLIAVVPMAAYIMASAAWADNPAGSIVPATMLALNIVIAAALSGIVNPTEMLKIMARVNIVLVLASFVLVAIDPLAVKTDPTRPGLLMPGELFGAYGTKTDLGNAAAISIVILLFLPSTIETRWRRVLALVILAVGMTLSNSASSLSAGLVASAALVGARLLPRLRTWIFGLVATMAVIWSLILPFINLGALTSLLGRSPDITGRGTFWPMVPGFIAERPFFGYGYNGFFNTGPYSRVWDLWKYELYFHTPEFHNTLLDVLIGLGLFGGFAYLVILVLSLTIFAHRTLERHSAEILGAILILLTIGAASEFKFFVHNSLATIFLFYCFFVGGRRYARRRPPESSVAEPPLRLAA